jgi:hypothetical protein
MHFKTIIFFPSVANTSGAAFVQPVQGGSQDDARASQASSQRTRNGNIDLLVLVEKISPLSKAHIACSTQQTAQAQSVSEGDRTNFLSLDICTSSDQDKQKRISK